MGKENLIHSHPGSTFANVLRVCSWCGQMFEWCCGRGLRILLLPGKLNLRHWRNARNLRTLPAHSCYFQHWGEWFCPPQRAHHHRRSRPTVLFTCRAKPLWRKACSVSRRESRPRFSRRSVAATSSRGWLQRSVSEKSAAASSRDVPVLTASCRGTGAGRVLHQSGHLHRSTDQPRYHCWCGAGAHTLPQQVSNTHTHTSDNISKWGQTWKILHWSILPNLVQFWWNSGLTLATEPKQSLS